MAIFIHGIVSMNCSFVPFLLFNLCNFVSCAVLLVLVSIVQFVQFDFAFFQGKNGNQFGFYGTLFSTAEKLRCKNVCSIFSFIQNQYYKSLLGFKLCFMVGWLGQSRFCGFSDVQTQLWFALFIINSAKNIKLYKYKFNVSSGNK